MPWELESVLPRELVIEGLAALDTLPRLTASLDALDNPRLKVTALELAWYMRHQLLRDADWAGMAHSLEIRVPFVDVELLERLAPLLASAAPPGKAAMADTPRTKLPDGVRSRAKTGFVVPVREWVMGMQGTPSAAAHDRGLRGWARMVYAAFTAPAQSAARAAAAQ
jgi:asparagine synthase (glutamine-hydrolysing)